MTQIAQGAHAYLTMAPGQVYRVQADDVATVQVLYGAPSAVVTLTAESRSFGPYDADARIKVTANTAAAEYTLLRAHYVELTQAQLDGGAVGALASDNAGGAIEPDGDVPTLGGAVTLPAMQSGFDAGTAPQKAAFKASVSGDRVAVRGVAKRPKPSGRRSLGTYAGATVALLTTRAADIAGVKRHRIGGVANILGCATLPVGIYQQTQVPSRGTAIVGVEFMLAGSARCDLYFVASGGATCYWRVYVDGAPIGAEQSAAATNLSNQYLDITLADTGPHRVTILLSNVQGFVSVGTSSTGVIYKALEARPKLALVGDSYIAGNAGNGNNPFQAAAGKLWDYGFEVCNAGFGSTGYIAASTYGTFGSSQRVACVQAFNPDYINFFGSINDNSQTGVQAAAEACYAAYLTACPTAAMTIIGVQPSGTAVTLVDASSPTTARAVYAAAQAFGKATYIDPLGIAHLPAVPTAFTAGTYTPGQLVTHDNCVWSFDGPSSQALALNDYPQTTLTTGGGLFWRQVTAFLWGSGNTASGSGSRLLLLHTDNTHYTPVGNDLIADYIYSAI